MATIITWDEALAILADGTADADRRGQATAVVYEAVNELLGAGEPVDEDWISHGDYSAKPSPQQVAAEWRELCAEVVND